MAGPPEKTFGQKFSFKGWDFVAETGTLNLHYANPEFGDFTETYVFPALDPLRWKGYKKQISTAFDCLHWMAGVSYYKTTLAEQFTFTGATPDVLQAEWLTKTWQAGLAELAVENELSWLDHIQFAALNPTPPAAKALRLAPRSLVAIGGGKDSLVSIEAIKSMGEPASLFMVGQSRFIAEVAMKTGLPLIQIERRVDTKLRHANANGAFNGHVPITAINACVGVVAALLYDFDNVIFSNERSADVGNFKTDTGQWVNHQYSKSLAYEKLWQQVIKDSIATDLHCFSLLRPFSELAIVQQFAKLKKYFPYFSSCNRNFHLAGSQNEQHHWCGSCPKCAFVFLCLAPFIAKQELLAVFKKDLLEDQSLLGLFESLLGIQGVKPFECVGEEQECRLALKLLSVHPDWQTNQQIQRWIAALPKMDEVQQKDILSANSAHLIPSKRQFAEHIIDVT